MGVWVATNGQSTVLPNRSSVRDAEKSIGTPFYTLILRKFSDKIFFPMDQIPFINYFL